MSKSKSVERLRSGRFERGLSLTRMSLLAGSRFAIQSARDFWAPAAEREQRRSARLSAHAEYLVEELGRLKGSVVKIGQMMALYGEHFLPPEVTAALHTLEDRTVALDWSVMRRELERELGRSALRELDIDPVPIGAASLGQVHLARRRSDDAAICLKIQYPGVADSIDGDIDAVATLLKVGSLVNSMQEFETWLDEVRGMLHREVDYRLEADTTRRFRERLRDDRRFIVPKVYDEYSTGHVLATSFERGFPVTAGDVDALPLRRRNAIAEAFLELFLREVFQWDEMQTDPNFGNYRIALSASGRGRDRIVLLDFGAVQTFPASFMEPLRGMIRGAYEADLDKVMAGARQLGFMREEYPEAVQRSFAEVCTAVIEPLVVTEGRAPEQALNSDGQYCWQGSNLPKRVAKRAARSAFSRYFTMPPRDFVFLNRKLIGVYTFISVLDAQFNGGDILEAYL
jgi:predicted unusual protein kinase regulating ubiquinone biosynthesis (AarF/ABC1/UbiB family)